MSLTGLFIPLALLVAGCNGDAEPTTTEPPTDEVVGHQEVARQSGEVGDVAFILVPPGDHTQGALESLVRGLLEADEDLWGIEVFDNEAALEAGLSPLLTADDVALLNAHHLVSVIAGRVIRFQGPLSDWGEHPVADE